MVYPKNLQFASVAGTVLALASTCNAIVSGTTAAVGDFPFIVSVQTPGSGGYRQLCGGSIIGPKTVLAAAVCCDGREANTLSVRYGSHNRVSGGTWIEITKTIIHPDWDADSFSNDFCLLYIDSPDLTANIQPVALATTPSAVREGSKLQIAGWGFTAANGALAPLELQSAEQTVLSSDKCQASWGDAEPVICAASDSSSSTDVSACFWDQGGPLYDAAASVLVGVSSHYNSSCTGKPQPNLYADVYAAKDWINSQIE